MITAEQAEALRAEALRRATLHLMDPVIPEDERIHWAMLALVSTESQIEAGVLA